MALFALATQAAAIAQQVQAVLGQVNTLLSRGVVVHIENRTSLTLRLLTGTHDSGDFNDPPDPVVPPEHASIFGSKGSLSLGPATSGRVQYRADGIDLDYHLSWEVPVLGDNTGSSRCDGGAREYFVASSSIGAFEASVAKHDLSFRNLEDTWHRCARCGMLNRRTADLDSACVMGAVHDNTASSKYFIIASGAFGVNPFVAKRCIKCDCMTSIPGVLGACAAGAEHEASDAMYTVVSHAKAPGEAGWHVCAKCTGFVRDASRACPAGGTHVVVPVPEFTFWN